MKISDLSGSISGVAQEILATLSGEEELAGNCDYVLDSLFFIAARPKWDMRKCVNEMFGCDKATKERLVACSVLLAKLRKDIVKIADEEALAALPRTDIVFDWLVARLREEVRNA